MTKLQPLGARVLVKPQEKEEVTKGGLIVPASANEDKKSATGTVVKLGAGTDKKGKKVEFNVKVGDVVFFKRYSPEELEIEGETYYILESDDILAVLGR